MVLHGDHYGLAVAYPARFAVPFRELQQPVAAGRIEIAPDHLYHPRILYVRRHLIHIQSAPVHDPLYQSLQYHHAACLRIAQIGKYVDVHLLVYSFYHTRKESAFFTQTAADRFDMIEALYNVRGAHAFALARDYRPAGKQLVGGRVQNVREIEQKSHVGQSVAVLPL